MRPGDTSDVLKPFLMSENVSELFSLGSSSAHVFLRKKGGEIGFCGWNEEGQLGNGSTSTPSKIQTKNKIGGIKSSEIESFFSNNFAFFIPTTRGEVFSTGGGRYSGHSKSKLKLTKLEFPEEENVIGIVSGYFHTVFMTSQGQI